jgi:hypothetical protein
VNTLEAHMIINPSGVEDECAKLLIDDISIPFLLTNIVEPGTEYTFSFWVKSDADGSVTAADLSFHTSSDWTKYQRTFVAESSDFQMQFDVAGIYYIYHPKLEIGTIATDWTPAPEDVAMEKDIDNISKEIISITESVSALNVNANNIYARVEENQKTIVDSVDTLNSSLGELAKEVSAKMSAEAIEIQISSAMKNGTSKVVTETGFTFDDEGLTVEKSGREMKTQITEDGMKVFQNEEVVLMANNQGVDAKNLHATTYLIVGGRSRFENYGSSRTGCFWIGG